MHKNYYNSKALKYCSQQYWQIHSSEGGYRGRMGIVILIPIKTQEMFARLNGGVTIYKQ